MKPELPILPGETPIENAPSIELGNGGLCIPQHYLLYRHTRLSVEKIVLDIDYNDRYIIFVCQDKGGVYVQIGIVGFDNYISRECQNGQKVVYGRKWRVEPQLPTSEIIQTVFLALKKAREHEIRELFRLTHGKQFTTPFNNHHDLPLISQNADLVLLNNEIPDFQNLKTHLESVRYDFAELRLKTVEKRPNEKWLIDIEIKPDAKGQLPEIKNMDISFLMDSLSMNDLYYHVMNKFLSLSDRHVDEHFLYKGFARFSWQNSVIAIAELSSVLRKKIQDKDHHAFSQAFEAAIYETDQTRVPKLYDGVLSDKIKSTLARFDQLNGILPD